MVLANLAFVLANLWVVVREQIRVRRDRARLHQSLLNAELTQRRDLASRLHDEVLQDLIYLKLRSDELAGDLPPERRAQTAGELTTGIGGAIRYLRQMMEDLQPIRHQGRTLAAALLQLERKVRQRYGIRTVFTLPQDFPQVPDREAEALYRAAQEVVVNACKHSRCRTLSLHLATESKSMELSIRDDGVGFETGSAQRPNHGLAYLRDRIAWLGGQVRIDSQSETGTLILISLPLSRAEDTQ
jgi:signal transduction histidine kinase